MAKTGENGGVGWYPLPIDSLPNPFIFAIDAHPLNALSILACPSAAGVYRSTDGGATWRISSKGLPAGKTVMALTRDIGGNIYAGTNGAGVYKSTDGGESWTAVNEGLTNLQICLGALTADPDDNIFVGTERGAFRLTATGRPISDF